MNTATITHRRGDYYGDGADFLIWEITDEQGVAAELYVTTDGRFEIANVETREDRRGEGLARALYTAAAEVVDIHHAPAAHRTPEGDAFAGAIGGPVAEYACDCAACDTTDED